MADSQLLLFLLPPSCIVVPIGETANKFTFQTSFSTTILSINHLSRDSSMSSTVFSTIYHERMEMNNGIDIDSDQLIEFPMLSYEEERKKEFHLRKMAETTNNTGPQDGNNKAFSIQANHGNHVPSDSTRIQTPCVDDDNIINIQLPYDPNGPTEPDLWSGNFQSISLHGSVEHIALDLKNIK